MKCTEKTTKTYLLELPEAEAIWLQSLCQNPIPGDIPTHNQFREQMFIAIKKARQGPEVCRESTAQEQRGMISETFIGGVRLL